jgi:hypothetical protein
MHPLPSNGVDMSLAEMLLWQVFTKDGEYSRHVWEEIEVRCFIFSWFRSCLHQQLADYASVRHFKLVATRILYGVFLRLCMTAVMSLGWLHRLLLAARRYTLAADGLLRRYF